MSAVTARFADRLVLPTLVLAVIALGLGIFLPVVEVDNLVLFANRFSIAEAAWRLLNDGEVLLGTVIVVFSVVFPLGKILAALIVLRGVHRGDGAPDGWIERLEFFGRWSCADVLIVAVAIVVTKSTGIANAHMDIGLWFFAGSVLLTAIGVQRLKILTRLPVRG